MFLNTIPIEESESRTSKDWVVPTPSGTSGHGPDQIYFKFPSQNSKQDPPGHSFPKFGIGATGPSTMLHVLGSSGATIATFADGGATTCTVTPASTGFACSSDERLKKNIESFSDAASLENILQLRTVTYDWRSVDNGRHTGYIAQELEKVAPEFVRTGEDGFKQVNYTGLVPWITGAIKAFYAEFRASDEIKSREIASVNSKTDKLEAQNAAIKQENATIKQENAELKARLDQQEKELAAIKNKLGL
ncbi:MAG: tail fiber domain-containing protein [Deltaproteobacteria bacterium]|nr:tail fiber domain-containing protein [Deltaproteobacteria bacterium]